MKKRIEERSTWKEFKNLIPNNKVTLGRFYSYQILNTPRNILFTLSHYKFASKIIGENKYVLEVGCNEGLGTLILSEFAKKIVAIDVDKEAIKEAIKSFKTDKIDFKNIDFFDAQLGAFDAIVCLDVLEHVYKENENMFFSKLCKNLRNFGLCIIGTPNETSKIYASEKGSTGHVNYYSWDKLKKQMDKYFHQVFIFSVNDEVVHTGFYPMAHYLIGIGVCKKSHKTCT